MSRFKFDNQGVCHVSVGDTIPYCVSTGYVINYIIEKIKVREDGTLKIRCRHSGGGANRSFTVEEVNNLLKSNGKEM